MRRHRRSPHNLKVFLTFEFNFSEYTVYQSIKSDKRCRIVYLDKTALMTAVGAGRTVIVDQCIELGADVNNPNLLRNWYCTTLIAHSLLNAGAPGIGLFDDYLIFYRVCREWDDSLIQSVIESVPTDTKITDLDYLLVIASEAGRVCIVNFLLYRGAKVTDNAINSARIHGHLDLADFLKNKKE